MLKILDNLITIFGFPENLTLNDESGKEFNRDEFLTKEIKHEKDIAEVGEEFISSYKRGGLTKNCISRNHTNNKWYSKSDQTIVYPNMVYLKNQNMV